MQWLKIIIILRLKSPGTCLFTFWISTYLMLSFKSKPNESRSRTLFFRRQVLKLRVDRFSYVKCRNWRSIAQICKINYKLYQPIVFHRMFLWRVVKTRSWMSLPWPFIMNTASNNIFSTVKILHRWQATLQVSKIPIFLKYILCNFLLRHTTPYRWIVCT